MLPAYRNSSLKNQKQPDAVDAAAGAGHAVPVPGTRVPVATR